MGSNLESELGYDGAVRSLDHFGSVLKGLLERALRLNDVGFHSIDYRVKSEQSAQQKLRTKRDRYRKVSDLHDLLGIRIITYFPDEVDRAAEIISAEFDLNSEDSVDKRSTLEPDRFGYLSLHYVLKLSKAREALPEYAAFRGIQFELQIRSILQHAWAEIEHDLGYKHSAGVPSEVRRRFSRLAGLLEIADDEFRRLRDDLKAYGDEIQKKSGSAFSALEINQATLFEFIQRSDLVRELDTFIAARIQGSPQLLPEPVHLLGTEVDRLLGMGIATIQELQEVMQSHKMDIKDFAEAWLLEPLDDDEYGEALDVVYPGISLFYLHYILVATRLSGEQRDSALGFIGSSEPRILVMQVMRVWNDVLAARKKI